MNRVFAALGFAFLLSAGTYAMQTAQKVIKDPAEYNAYINALNAQGAEAKAAAMEGFISQFPASVVKMDALEQAMAAYQQTNNTNKVGQTAERILQIDPANVRALAIAAFTKRATATAIGDPKMAQEVGSFARAGLAALPGWTQPVGMSENDFEKLRNQVAAIFHGAAGFAALQNKDFAAARDSYLKALAIDPSNMEDTYQLAVAELQMTPLDVNGFWYAAKAINLAQRQNQGAAGTMTDFTKAINTITDYAKAMYRRYHGDMDGWDKLVAAAAGQTAPPANFAVAIKKAPTAAEIACQAVAENDPDSLSFSDLEFILTMRDSAPCNKEAANKAWAAIRNKEKQGAAKLRISVKVISVSDESIEAAITEENQSANQADLKVAMKEPLKNPLAPGAMIDVIGVIKDYTLNPFMFLMEQGELPEGQQ